MGLFILVVVVGAAAFVIGKSWFVTVPVVIGIIASGVLLIAGGSLQDTPLPFAVTLATIAAGSAILVRRRVTAT